ncbi:MAG TPA: hypothetical protein PKI66_06385 [Methanobacteriaceae archaeon]|nr:hypothetical protein [Methanobacteriaceae archaeon]
MAEVGYIRPENFHEIQKYHDRLIKRWRRSRWGHGKTTPIKEAVNDWVVIK